MPINKYITKIIMIMVGNAVLAFITEYIIGCFVGKSYNVGVKHLQFDDICISPTISNFHYGHT